MVLKKNENIKIFDGAIGTEVQKRTPTAEDNLTDLLNSTRPEIIKNIHLDYLDAGAQVLTTNTFSSNEIRLSRSGHGKKTSELNERGANLAREAVKAFSGEEEKVWIAGSIGPTGENLVPLGDWTFDQFYSTFLTQAQALKRGGVDWLIIETMESLREAKAALLASKEVELPVISSLSYGSRGRTSYGVVPASGAITLDYIGADVLGINCGTGPKPYPDIIKTYSRSSSKPLLAEANAGSPRLEDGKAVYDLTPRQYLEEIEPGISFLWGVGSCCGSDPSFTKMLAEASSKYEGRKEDKFETESKFITNNSGVINLSEETEFIEIDIDSENLKNLKEKVDGDSINMLHFSGIPRPYSSMENVLARQFLKLRSSKPLGIVTDDSELLKTFLKASPGISPVRATGNKPSIRKTAEKYGGLLI